MLSLTQQAIIILASIVGSAGVALLGWLESGEPFDSKKFLGSILRSIPGGVVAALGFQSVNSIDLFVLLSAAIAGSGADNSISRANKVRKKNGG